MYEAAGSQLLRLLGLKYDSYIYIYTRLLCNCGSEMSAKNAESNMRFFIALAFYLFVLAFISAFHLTSSTDWVS